jgi:hypothetical protein
MYRTAKKIEAMPHSSGLMKKYSFILNIDPNPTPVATGFEVKPLNGLIARFIVCERFNTPRLAAGLLIAK